MKDVKWAKEKLKKVLDIDIPKNRRFERGYQNGVSNSLDVLNQINEPELPEIPQYVADCIENMKKEKYDMFYAYKLITEFSLDLYPSNNYKTFIWLDSHPNEEIFAKAWIDGYKVK